MGYTTHKGNRHLALAKRGNYGLLPTVQPEDSANKYPFTEEARGKLFGGMSNFMLFIKRAKTTDGRDKSVTLINKLLHEVFPAWSDSRIQVMSELMYNNLAERDRQWITDSLETETVETKLDDLGLSDWPEGFDDGEETKW